MNLIEENEKHLYVCAKLKKRKMIHLNNPTVQNILSLITMIDTGKQPTCTLYMYTTLTIT